MIRIEKGSTVVDQNGVEWLVLTEMDEHGEFDVVNETGRRTATLRLVKDEVAS